ncbi:dihydrodipicolinate reductase [uncultured Desulfobacter sp.]|uniref:dihydrodipicolinate reductase n=1 Tax=uncultured Desulfobacter sp. TaxID=240139 RepID=UPI0029F58509|nr:dihydrodipicolinate reductase [uncultured Desulfobacter sp.]
MNCIPVMISGLPGNVARIMASAALKDGRFSLVPFSLTGEEITQDRVSVDQTEVTLLKPSEREDKINEILEAYPGCICVDYTHPTAVNDNAKFYVRYKIPFVMGTTGGDRQDLEQTVSNGSMPAVIAPNMAKQIVGLQAMIEYGANTFPGLFKGFTLQVTESHQQGKADTSGTAKALVASFNQLGADFKISDIEKIRDPKIQQGTLGVPEEFIDGHGWHTYTLTAPDGSALFELKHNINGRQIYASGTFDAVVFLQHRIDTNDFDQKLFTMIDVLTAGK